MNTPPSKCFHNGIILIVICFQICVDKYTYFESESQLYDLCRGRKQRCI